MENIPKKKEEFSFWKNLILSFLFFSITPIAIIASLFSLIYLPKDAKIPLSVKETSFIQSPQSGVRVYASLPTNFPLISGHLNTADARPEIIRQYLLKYNSPLHPYSSEIVDTADKYGLDFRLITAIAQQESNLCKKIPPETNNCWGWGIHSRGTLGFSSYQEGIEEVSRGLRNKYLNSGLLSIEDIMSKYTPLSPGSWAEGVNKFMSEME